MCPSNPVILKYFCNIGENLVFYTRITLEHFARWIEIQTDKKLLTHGGEGEAHGWWRWPWK
jgi:hypothetical protein